MYYNRFIGKLVLDSVDYFLISAFIGSLIAKFLKEYLSEKQSMKRLKNSIIKKTEVLELEEVKENEIVENYRKKPFTRKQRLLRIYRYMIGLRGGDDDTGYNLARAIQKLFEDLLVKVHRAETRAKILRIIFTQGRIVLELILRLSGITFDVKLRLLNGKPDFIVYTWCAGGISGFVVSWISAGSILVTPPLLAVTFFVRSFVQQIIYDTEFRAFRKNVIDLFEDQEFREKLRQLIQETNKKFIKSKELASLEVLKEHNQNLRMQNLEILDKLNLNKNPHIREAAERLGILNDPQEIGPDFSFETTFVDDDNLFDTNFTPVPTDEIVDVEIIKE